MTSKKLLSVLATTAFVASAGAKAEDAISANVTLATDYTFRGISQTDERPAIQGGFDYAHESGIYLGTWASNVEFGTQSSTEIDLYVGYAGEFGNGLGYDISAIHFEYEGDGKFDYEEYALSFSYADFSLGVVYSDEYLGDGGPKFWYPNASYSYALAENWSLDLSVGYSDIDADDFWGDGEDSYFDWSIGVGTSAGGVDLALAWVGTDLDEDEAGNIVEPRFVFSISKSF